MTDGKWSMPVKGLQHSLCATCRWKNPGASTCMVFPRGIPTEILLGIADHRKPYPGDLGIQYEPRDDAVLEPSEYLGAE